MTETILKAIRGSNLYGTNNSKSDNDFIEIIIPNLKNMVLGNCDYSNQTIVSDKDTMTLSYSSFIKRLGKNDFNMIELLFLPKDKIIFKNNEWDKLVSIRDKFITNNISNAIGISNSVLDELQKFQKLKEMSAISEKLSKSIRHSERILQENIELLNFKKITFPRPNASNLVNEHFVSYTKKEIIDTISKITKLQNELKELAINYGDIEIDNNFIESTIYACHLRYLRKHI